MKAQAAMEFLSSYGWAILVSFAAIGSLVYFGILDPSKLLPDKCIGTAGLDCAGKASITGAASAVEFVVRNNLGAPIEIYSASSDPSMAATAEGGSCVAIAGEKVAAPPGGVAGDILISHDEQVPGDPSLITNKEVIRENEWVRVRVVCPEPLQQGQRFTENIELRYRNANTGLDHKAKISITGPVT